MELALNEIGALCMGLTAEEYENKPGRFTDWRWPNGRLDKAPDIELAEPPTDAQYGSIQRLVDKAVLVSAKAFARALEDELGYPVEGARSGLDYATMGLLFGEELLRSRRNAAMHVLCPEQHREQLKRHLEGE